MEHSETQAFLDASRHVPKLLRHQLLCHLSSRYMVDESISSESHVFLAQDQMCSTQPSMERFYGALLFVDISGFTALSLKLDVESLKNHINDYFSKMLDVIDKWSGDVIKFAGDALYIVWQVNVPVPGFGSERHRISTAKNVLSDPKFLAAAKSSVEKAVNCALEINFSCCNHKIILGENANEAKSRWTKLFNSLPLLLGHQGQQQQQTQKPKPITGSSNSEEIAYLNVHSGIGFGLMAGVDIGANDRWEYFLLGDPITQSAMAEGKAAMGDVVVSQIAHSLIHELDNEFIDCCNEELPCGCWQFEGGFFKVTNRAASGKTGATNRKKLSRRRSKSKIKIEEFYLNQELESNEAKLLEDYNEEVDSIVAMMFHSLKKKVFRFISDYNIEIGALNPQLNDMDEKNEFPDDQHDKEDESPIPTFGSQVPFSQSTADSVKVGSPNTEENKQQVTFSTKEGDMSQKSEHSTESGKFSTKGMRKMEKFLVQFVSNQLKPAFVNWLHKCIVDDLVRHTHEAPRKRFEFAAYQRVSILDDFLRSYFFYQGNIIGLTRNLRSSVQFSPARHGSVDFNSLTIENGNYYPNSNAFANQGQNIIKRGTRLSKTQNFLNDVGLSAELRVVTVMFIKIDCLDVSLFVEDDPSESLKVNERKAFASKFNFIQRSSWEESSDSELLSRLEQCMTIICNAFAENDGQLRQFIVDDKGTVCIGTFGLRGSMAVDNAASAIECAKTIVMKLHDMDLTVSIGITTGKGYCGSVGSRFRYEYAVMGPSTNLSARLMGKAGPNQIICDTETRNRDRTHRFEALSAIKAKGYTDPVQTYMPVFEDQLYPGQNRDESPDSYVLANRKKSLSVGFIRSSLDSAALEYILSRSIKADAELKKLTGETEIKTGENGQGIDLASESKKSKESIPPTEEFLNEVVETEFVVHKRRGSRDYTLQERRDSLKTKLYGRDKEIKEIVTFLFFPFLDHLLNAYHHAQNPSVANILNLGGSPRNQLSPMISPKENPNTSLPMILSKGNSGKLTRKFDITTPTRMLTVTGKEGFGKSSLVTAIAKKILLLSKNNKSYNVNVFKNHTISVVSTTPFQSIKSIIHDLLLKYFKIFKTKEIQAQQQAQSQQPNPAASNNPPANGLGSLREQSFRGQMRSEASFRGPAATLRAEQSFRGAGIAAPIGGSPLLTRGDPSFRGNIGATPGGAPLGRAPSQKMSNHSTTSGKFQPPAGHSLVQQQYNAIVHTPFEQQLQQGLKYLIPLLPSDSQLFIPLLTSAGIINDIPDNEFTESLAGKSRLLSTLDLLCSMFEVFPVVTGNALLLIFEKLHLFDSWSLSLLNQLWQNSKGIVMLCTYCPVVRESNLKENEQKGSEKQFKKPAFNRQGTERSVHSSRKNGKDNGFDPELFFQQYQEDESRFKLLYLSLLDKEAITNITLDTMNLNHGGAVLLRGSANNGNTRSSISNTAGNLLTNGEVGSALVSTTESENINPNPVNENLLNQIYDMCGGNPLYALALANTVNLTELNDMNSFSNANNNPGNPENASSNGTEGNNNDNGQQNNNPAGTTTGNNGHETASKINIRQSQANLDSILSGATGRISEIICYRFDQLDTLTQVILKTAAVICSSNNYTFTMDHLLFLMSDDANPEIATSELDLVQCIRNLLRNEEFIVIVDHLRPESDNVLFPIDEPPMEPTPTQPHHNEQQQHGESSSSVSTAFQYSELNDGTFIPFANGNPSSYEATPMTTALKGENGHSKHFEFPSIHEQNQEMNQDINNSFSTSQNPLQFAGSGGDSEKHQDYSPNSQTNKPKNSSVRSRGEEFSEYTIRTSKFSFRVILEQVTIYDLLVQEQREHIHELVASYYRKLNSVLAMNNIFDIKSLLEEAFHWNHASIWPYAISCHYKAATQYKEQGDYENFKIQLKLITSLYSTMRKDNGLLPQQEFSLQYLVNLYQHYDNDVQLLKNIQQQAANGPTMNNNNNNQNNNEEGNNHNNKFTSPQQTQGIPLHRTASDESSINRNIKTATGNQILLSNLQTNTNTNLSSVATDYWMPTQVANSVQSETKFVLQYSLDLSRSESIDQVPSLDYISVRSGKSNQSKGALNNNANTNNNKSKAAGVKSTSKFFYTYSNAKILYEMCLGDGDALTTLLSAQISMAQSHMMSFESPLQSLSILEDCLMILFLYQKYMLTHHYQFYSQQVKGGATAYSKSNNNSNNTYYSPSGSPEKNPLSTHQEEISSARINSNNSPVPQGENGNEEIKAPSTPTKLETMNNVAYDAIDKPIFLNRTLMSQGSASFITAGHSKTNKNTAATNEDVNLHQHHPHLQHIERHIYQKFNKPSAFTIQSFEYYLCQVYSLYIYLNAHSPISNTERMKKAWFLCEKYLIVSSDPQIWATMNFLNNPSPGGSMSANSNNNNTMMMPNNPTSLAEMIMRGTGGPGSLSQPIQSFPQMSHPSSLHSSGSAFPVMRVTMNSFSQEFVPLNNVNNPAAMMNMSMNINQATTQATGMMNSASTSTLPFVTAASPRTLKGSRSTGLLRSSLGGAGGGGMFLPNNISPIKNSFTAMPITNNFLAQNNLRFLSKVHSIQSTCIYILLLLKENQIMKAVKKMDRLLSNYSVSKYSNSLIDIYGYDITQYTLTLLCQQLIFISEIEKSFSYFAIIFENLSQLKHYYSLVITFFPLLSLCLFLRKFQDIYHLLNMIEKYEKETFHLNIFPTILKFQIKYLLLMGMILWNDNQSNENLNNNGHHSSNVNGNHGNTHTNPKTMNEIINAMQRIHEEIKAATAAGGVGGAGGGGFNPMDGDANVGIASNQGSTINKSNNHSSSSPAVIRRSGTSLFQDDGHPSSENRLYYHLFLSNPFIHRVISRAMSPTAQSMLVSNNAANSVVAVSSPRRMQSFSMNLSLLKEKEKDSRLTEMNAIHEFYQNELYKLRHQSKENNNNNNNTTKKPFTNEAQQQQSSSSSPHENNISSPTTEKKGTAAAAADDENPSEGISIDKDFQFLYKNSYFGYFLYLQGISIESLLLIIQLLEYFVHHHEELHELQKKLRQHSNSNTIKDTKKIFSHSITIYEKNYLLMMKMKEKYFNSSNNNNNSQSSNNVLMSMLGNSSNNLKMNGGNPNIHQNNTNILSELIPFSILLSLYNDFQNQLSLPFSSSPKTPNKTPRTPKTPKTPKLKTMMTVNGELVIPKKIIFFLKKERILSNALLNEIDSLIMKCEKLNYPLPLGILGELITQFMESTTSFATNSYSKPVTPNYSKRMNSIDPFDNHLQQNNNNSPQEEQKRSVAFESSASSSSIQIPPPIATRPNSFVDGKNQNNNEEKKHREDDEDEEEDEEEGKTDEIEEEKMKWYQIGQDMKLKCFELIQQNNNPTQLQGFEYLYYRVTNIFS